MKDYAPWLRQGDIFEEVPWIDTVLTDDQGITAAVGSGAALLITHGCMMDKRTNSGRPTAKRLQFLPLHPITNLNPDSQQRLRRRHEVSPPEAIYVGVLPDGTEAFGLLGEAYTLPTAYFAADIELCDGHPEADPSDPYHLVPLRHDHRLGTLEDNEIDLMHRKMLAFWLHIRPE